MRRRELVAAPVGVSGLAGCLDTRDWGIMVQNETRRRVTVDLRVRARATPEPDPFVDETVTLAARGGLGQRATGQPDDPRETMIPVSVHGGPEVTRQWPRRGHLIGVGFYIDEFRIEVEERKGGP
jgi:hypothetical protein